MTLPRSALHPERTTITKMEELEVETSCMNLKDAERMQENRDLGRYRERGDKNREMRNSIIGEDQCDAELCWNMKVSYYELVAVCIVFLLGIDSRVSSLCFIKEVDLQ